MPASFSAAISLFIRAAFAVRAAFAAEAVVETPKENCASSGTVVTTPVPCTVIVRGAAAPAGEEAATAETASASEGESPPESHRGHLRYAAAGACVTRFGTAANGKHRPGSPLTWP